MFDKTFIAEFIKETGIDKLVATIQSLSTKVDDLTNATDLKTYSLKQAQEACGVNWQALRRSCISGELKHFKIGDKYQVQHKCLREYLDKKTEQSTPLRKVG